jgi:hypothetical protein
MTNKAHHLAACGRGDSHQGSRACAYSYRSKMKATSLIISILIFSSACIAEEINVQGGQFKRVSLGQNEKTLRSMKCEFEILEEYRDTDWGPVITLGLSDSEDNEFIQVLYTTTKKDKYYLFKTKNGSVKNGDIDSHFLSLPMAYGAKVSLSIVPWGENGGTFDYRAKVGESIKASGYIINPYLRSGLNYSVTFSSVRAKYECSFL